MIRRPPRSTLDRSSAASDVYKRQPLHRAEGDELTHVLREPAQRRAGEEDAHRDEEERPPTVGVAQLAVERRGRGRGDEEGGHHPGEMPQPTELADDSRERGGD